MMCERLTTNNLSPFLDGALSDAERAVVEEHLGVCGACQSRLEGLRAMKHAVARLSSDEAPPGAVRARVEALRFRPFASRRRLLLAAVAGASVTVIVVAAVALIDGAGMRGPSQSLADVLVTDHLKSIPEAKPVEIASSDPAALRAFYAGRIPFDPVVPALAEAELIGARLCKIEGRRVELLFYQVQDQTLSLFVSDQRPSDDGCRTSRGHAVCSVVRGGLTYHLVGDAPEIRLRAILAGARP